MTNTSASRHGANGGNSSSARIERFMNGPDTQVLQGCLKIGPATLVEQVGVEGPVVLGAHCSARRAELGRYTVTGDNCRFTDCRVGGFCSFGDNVLANAGTHPTEWVSTSLFSCNPTFWDWAEEYRRAPKAVHEFQWRVPANIGNDVWIGGNVVILTGVSVGDGAIVGANSVVTKDVPPYAIVAGAPARVLRKRFDDETVEALGKSSWWTLPIEEILSLPLPDVHRTLEKLRLKGP